MFQKEVIYYFISIDEVAQIITTRGHSSLSILNLQDTIQNDCTGPDVKSCIDSLFSTRFLTVDKATIIIYTHVSVRANLSFNLRTGKPAFIQDTLFLITTLFVES